MATIIPKEYDHTLNKSQYTILRHQMKKNFESLPNELKNLSHELHNPVSPNEKASLSNYDEKDLHLLETWVGPLKSESLKTVNKAADIIEIAQNGDIFDLIIDQGSLDTLFFEDENRYNEEIIPLLNKLKGILSPEGRYVYISMLPNPLLKDLLTSFTLDNYQLTIAEFSAKTLELPIYLICAKKSSNLTNSQTSLSWHSKRTGKLSLSKEEIMNQIISRQISASFKSSFKDFCPGQRIFFDISVPQSTIGQYSVIICDSPDKDMLAKKKCACYISSLGNENELRAFADKAIDFYILAQLKVSRLFVVVPARGFQYYNFKTTQNELSSVLSDLLPAEQSNVLFVTDGEDIKERKVIFEDSELFVSEQIKGDGKTYRSYLYKTSSASIESQVRIKHYNREERISTYPEADELTKLSLMPKIEGKVVGIDESFIVFECYRLFINGLAFISKQIIEKQSVRVLILGGGAGVLSKFLYFSFPNISIEAVDISKSVIDIANYYFEHPKNDPRHQIILGDALKYVQDMVDKAKNDSKEEIFGLYDLIIMDISDFSSGFAQCPPSIFTEFEFLKKIKSLLTNSGLFLMNIINDNEEMVESRLQEISKVFPLIYSGTIEQNTIAFFPNNGKQAKPLDKDEIKAAFKEVMKCAAMDWSPDMELEEFCDLISLRPLTHL